MNGKVRDMCLIAVMAAILCVLAPLSVPIGPIPLSLASLCVYIAGAMLGGVKGTAATALYVLIGCIGVPVFSGYGAGFAKLAGPTGGFIIGYIPCAAIIGFGIDLFGERMKCKGFSLIYPFAMILGTIVLYALGTAWFVISTGKTVGAAVAACVIPFLIGDAIKIIFATVLGTACRSRLRQIGILI